MVFEYAQKCLQHCKSLSLRISQNRQETELNETLYILLACRHINIIVATHFLWTSGVRTVAVHCITLYSSNRLFAYQNKV